jgi:hypothetical protein
MCSTLALYLSNMYSVIILKYWPSWSLFFDKAKLLSSFNKVSFFCIKINESCRLFFKNVYVRSRNCKVYKTSRRYNSYILMLYPYTHQTSWWIFLSFFWHSLLQYFAIATHLQEKVASITTPAICSKHFWYVFYSMYC